jgi:hypothetical protein
MITIKILGQTPSQKNNKQILRNHKTGQPFIASSNIVKRWQEDALLQLMAVRYMFTGRVQIDYMFYVVDAAQRDLDNMIASINDILQIANAEQYLFRGKMRAKKGTGIIKGDNWQLLRIGSADAAIDRENPRAMITIKDIEPVT